MMSLFKSLSGTRASNAKVVDGKLILSFPGAIKPVLWQMDLGGAKASALEVDERDGGHALVLRTPKGESHDIAVFASRDGAVGALMAVGGAMEKAHGQIHSYVAAPRSQALVPVPEQGNARQTDGGAVFKWLAGLTGIIILAILVNALWNLSPRAPISVASAQISPEALAREAGAQSNPEATGVPVSADDYLSSQ